MTKFNLFLLLLLGIMLTSCLQFTPPKSPDRTFTGIIQFQLGNAPGSLSGNIDLRIKKGRYDDYYVTDGFEKSIELKDQKTIHETMAVFGIMGDPRKAKQAISEYVSLPLIVEFRKGEDVVSKQEFQVDFFAGASLPRQAEIPVNDLGIVKL